jgi:hypothetical protein
MGVRYGQPVLPDSNDSNPLVISDSRLGDDRLEIRLGQNLESLQVR